MMKPDLAGLFIRSFLCLLCWGILTDYLHIPGGWWMAGNLLTVAILLAGYRLGQIRSRPPLPRRRKRVGPPMEWID